MNTTTTPPPHRMSLSKLCNRRDETPRGLANRELVEWLKLIGRQEVPYPQKETRRELFRKQLDSKIIRYIR